MLVLSLSTQEIKVGFRTPAGRLTELQTFKTVELPRLVRGKQGAWDPNVCLTWGDEFLSFLKSALENWHSDDRETMPRAPSDDADNSSVPHRQRDEESVWRVSFTPGNGVELVQLDEKGVEEVRNDEERVGFLPTSYWKTVASVSGAQ